MGRRSSSTGRYCGWRRTGVVLPRSARSWIKSSNAFFFGGGSVVKGSFYLLIIQIHIILLVSSQESFGRIVTVKPVKSTVDFVSLGAPSSIDVILNRSEVKCNNLFELNVSSGRFFICVLKTN